MKRELNPRTEKVLDEILEWARRSEERDMVSAHSGLQFSPLTLWERIYWTVLGWLR